MAMLFTLHFVGFWVFMTVGSWYPNYCGRCIKVGLGFTGAYQLAIFTLPESPGVARVRLGFWGSNQADEHRLFGDGLRWSLSGGSRKDFIHPAL